MRASSSYMLFTWLQSLVRCITVSSTYDLRGLVMVNDIFMSEHAHETPFPIPFPFPPLDPTIK